MLSVGDLIEVSAVQQTTSMVPETDKADTIFTAVRFVTLEYEPDSALAKQFNGKDERVQFSLSLNDSATDNGMVELVNAINTAIVQQKASPVRIENATLDYTASLKGSANKLSLAYKVVLEGILSNIVLDRAEQGTVLDLDWRSVVVNEPLTVKTQQYGNMSVNYPVGLFQATFPQFAQNLLNSPASGIMRDPLFNFQDIGVPMDRWHFLFDPTGSQAGAAGAGFEEIGGARVVSIYSLGESSFREGTFSEKRNEASATLNGTRFGIESTTPPPSGQIQIAGFSRIEKAGNDELAFVAAQAPEGTVTATGGFPIQVLLVLGGMMGAVAVFVLIKTRK
ncbi:MAG TPA: hypothetical protein VIP70_03345 [Nitrososphaeraceae archaeon]